MRSKLSIADQRRLNRAADYARKAPTLAGDFTPGSLVRFLRNHLSMSQAQLARRAKMPQSHLAKIEQDAVDVQWSSLKRLLGALFSEPLLLYKPQETIMEILSKRIHEAARKRVARIVGTMALEKQQPDPSTIEELSRQEETKLWERRSTEIWED